MVAAVSVLTAISRAPPRPVVALAALAAVGSRPAVSRRWRAWSGCQARAAVGGGPSMRGSPGSVTTSWPPMVCTP
ncbi:hypothetical protein [Streptacidiphilus sp. PAMC 29251]